MDPTPAPSDGPARDGSAYDTASALWDFLLLLRADESDAGARPLSHYLALFPGHEVEIAREFLARLDGARAASSTPEDLARYELGRLIGRGGMGEVVLARDVRLDRELAVKILRRSGRHARRRFLREVHITGGLDHPGVVPVHDLGEDGAGRPFFAMKHVEGVDLERVIEQVHQQSAQWTHARVLEVLIKVCDTMAFAHSRGIVHRDLKPSNIRVGRFGEVYVMDWGLARVMAESAEPDDEREPAPALSDTASLTMDGDVLGTPAYMAPEQAEGRTDGVGKAADVYSVGAMLYHLLTGQRPYAASRGPREVLELVRTRAPESVAVLAPRAPRELAAICAKAMERDPRQRYEEMGRIALDLRAFLDQRVVSAYDATLVERARKWTRRHLSLVVPAVLVLVAAAVAALLVRQQRVESRQRLYQLSRGRLVDAFDTFWPPQAANVASLERWLGLAEEVLRTREQDRSTLVELKRRALPMDPDAPAERAERARQAEQVRKRRGVIRNFEEMLAQIDRGERPPPPGQTREWVAAQIPGNRGLLEAELQKRPGHVTFRFTDDEDQILFDALTLLVSEQDEILAPDRPFGPLDMARWGVDAGRRVEELSLNRARAAWEEARRSIADRSLCPMYGGFQLEPQIGLVPIGRDPVSALWEFAHVLSGEVPVRDGTGRLQFDESSAIVLVLVPGGRFLRGSQHESRSGRNYDPWSEANAPLDQEELELQPFFLSKYELTQAQWQRLSGRNPSTSSSEEKRLNVSPLHPVESVAFDDSLRFMHILGLTLPTEAQWEWAARAGTDTPWSCGALLDSVIGYANLADRSAVLAVTVKASEAAILPELDDGFPVHAPVGSLLPNAFGLYDTIGNVREWCRDTGPFDYGARTQIETGLRLYDDDGTRVVRGGSFGYSPLRGRSAARDQVGPALRAGDVGIRPAREIER